MDCIHIRSYLVLQISLEEIPYIIYKTECGILSERNWTGVALWLETLDLRSECAGFNSLYIVAGTGNCTIK